MPMFNTFWVQDNADENDIRLWGEEPTEVNKVPSDVRLETLAVQEGIFKSLTEARKNGFSGPIPHGVAWWGTKKKRFCTLRPIKLDSDLNPVEEIIEAGPSQFNWTDKMGW